jgi:colanic acid/amylovoran biosynthesis glycosyltransferase
VQNLDQFPWPHLHVLSSERPRRFALGQRFWKIQRWNRAGFVGQIARDSGARILHSHFGDRGYADLEIARKAGLKQAVTFYGYDVNRLPTIEHAWLGRYAELFACADMFLCEGPHFARCLVALGCPEHKVRIQHLKMILEKIPFQPRVWHPGQPLKVLICGSFMEKKGIPDALEALGRIRGEVDLEITLIGDANHQERNKIEKQKILDTLDRAGLRARTRLLGYQPHAAMFQEAYRNHVFLSPSVTASDGDTEGGAPVTIIEMAASGMPVVSTRHCDIPNVILDGKTGLLADERNVNELSEHLLHLVREPEAWLAMLERGRHHIETEFDAATQGQRLAEKYSEIENCPIVDAATMFGS